MKKLEKKQNGKGVETSKSTGISKMPAGNPLADRSSELVRQLKFKLRCEKAIIRRDDFETEEQIFGDVMVADEPRIVGGCSFVYRGEVEDGAIFDIMTEDGAEGVKIKKGVKTTVEMPKGAEIAVTVEEANEFGAIVEIKDRDGSEDSPATPLVDYGNQYETGPDSVDETIHTYGRDKEAPKFHSQLFDQEGRYMGTYLTSEGRLIQEAIGEVDAEGLKTEFLSVRPEPNGEMCDVETCEPRYQGLIEVGDKVEVGAYEVGSKENTPDGAVFDIRCAETGEIVASNVVCKEGSEEVLDIKQDGKRIIIEAYGVRGKDSLVEIDVEDL